MQTIITGGDCKDTKIASDQTFDLTLSLLNKKTVYGLQNKYDSDIVVTSETNATTSANANTQSVAMSSKDNIIGNKLNVVQVTNIPNESDDSMQSNEIVCVDVYT